MCLRFRLEAAGRGALLFPKVGVSTQFQLARARVELGLVGPGPVSTRVAFDAVRSGGGTGYIGVAGEAIVPAFQIAEARVDVHKIGLSMAAGLVDDIWVMTTRPGWMPRWVSPMLFERKEWLDRSDLGGWISWTSPGRYVTVDVSLVTGEGLARRERNNGKDVAGTLIVRPLAFMEEAPVDLEAAIYAREGSRGADRARNHRVGARLTARHALLGGGIDAMWAWGHAGDGGQLPMGLSTYVRTGPDLPFLGWARFDASWASRDQPDTRELAWSIGAGPVLPWIRDAPVRPVHMAIGYEGFALDEGARVLAGAEASSRGHMLYLQFGALLEGRVGMSAAAGSRPLR
jgi:hypothetical protein